MQDTVKRRIYRKGIFLFPALGLTILIFMQNVLAQSESQNVPPEWQTLAEKTSHAQTPRYAGTVAYSQKLDAASPWIVYKSFGKSGEGRDLPLLIASKDKLFT